MCRLYSKSTFFFFFFGCSLWHVVEKEMATHSSTLAWRIPWMEEPDGLQSMGSQRVRHDWATSLWHVGSLFSNPGWNPCLLHWKHGVLNTGPPGKSWLLLLLLFLPMLSGLWDLSSLTRDQTHAPCNGKCWVLTSGPPGKSWIETFFTGEMLECSEQKVLGHLWLELIPRSYLRVLH